MPLWVVGDRGYSSHAFRELVRDSGARPAIPTRGNEAAVACPDYIYNNRNLVERLWGRLKEWRAVATRYEKTATSYLGVLCLAATMDWLKPYMIASHCPSGEVIFRKGDIAGKVYYTVTGRYRLAEIDVNVEPGQIIGEIGFIAPDKRRTLTFECVEGGQLLGDEMGMLKLLIHQENHRILGVHAIGTDATELIHIGQAVMAFNGTVEFFVDNESA